MLTLMKDGQRYEIKIFCYVAIYELKRRKNDQEVQLEYLYC